MLQRLVVIMLLVFSPLTIAMSIDNGRLAFAFEGSQVVFSGKVNDLGTTNATYPMRVVTFDIHTIWKGNITK
ncbi:MAG: hypothetical protein ACRD5H_08765, partial [Nitrososphaerales archaeon]